MHLPRRGTSSCLPCWRWDAGAVVSGHPCTVCVQVVLVSWVYGVDRWLDNLQEMELSLGRVTRAYWRLSWGVTTPLVLALLLLLAWGDAGHVGYQGSVYPGWVQAMGYLITGGSAHRAPSLPPCPGCTLLALPVCGLWEVGRVYTDPTLTLGSLVTPTKQWGPNLYHTPLTAEVLH